MSNPANLYSVSTDHIDIYIRMNGDNEKDYCFSVDGSKPARDLFTIFDTLPMVLSPNYFFNSRPIGFVKVIDPGFLTSEGGLLFTDNIKNTKPLKLDEPIGKQVFEGQLIEPIWEFNYTRWITVISVLLAWLYLDLPQFITPTPGIAPSTLAFKVIDIVMEYFGANEHSDINFSPDNETSSPFGSVPWQIAFFVFHILKVAVVYLLFWIGGINPYSFNPAESKKLKLRVINREILLGIGWTGARKATQQEWYEENRKNLIERHGGIVRAYHAGVLSETNKLGVQLQAGEGWDSENRAASPPYAFVITSQYYGELHQCLKIQIDEIDGLKVAEGDINDGDLDAEAAASALDSCLKRFRRIGPILGTKKLTDLYLKRKAVADEIEGADKKKNKKVPISEKAKPKPESKEPSLASDSTVKAD